MPMVLQKFAKITGAAVFAASLLLVSAPLSVGVADDEIKALERKLELLKEKVARKTEYQKMRGILEVNLKEVQDQIKMLDEEYKDVAKSASAPVEKETASVGGFAEMIQSMEKAYISLMLPEANSLQPFKLKKKDSYWTLQHQNNGTQGRIIDKGGDIIWLKQFPPNWPINGSWKFSRSGDKCRIDQLESDVRPGTRHMTWSCS